VTAPHDRPTIDELVEAVREFLERDVMAATGGRVQFHTRVAVNVLGMIERELALGPGQRAAHEKRLHELGFDDERAMADAIRRGDADDRYDEIKNAVVATVTDKLKVANPKYLDS
jgi:hypothetical protein